MDEKWVLQWFNDVWSNANSTRLQALATDPFHFHVPGGKSYLLSHTEYLNFITVWGQRFRDVTFRIIDTVSDDNKTVVVYQCHALYCGGWAKIPAKKQKVMMTGMAYFKHQGDKIVDCRLEDSSFDVYQQLTRRLE
ncbi:nuclear transport factor 2 family protein [Photobacterium lutimaris]|uniref:SnoaL-like domain-containing protein n=1 Tax=Photobacterium lutimaris TaxID=388278 RepID=A0A2T3J186_9GAMM|nr:nuclear transport factor 2 family protein [Photobacterium lutimaris]PSU34823.1 hypothetical protein C9I99_06965 [Photobacterium lutimaris]TDR77157.1 SnoaL-like polyketide cyclase [Photobacterium lutimaris]